MNLRTKFTPAPMNIGMQKSIVRKELHRGGFEDVGVDIEATLDLLDPTLTLPENLRTIRTEVKKEDKYIKEEYESERIVELIDRCVEDGIEACRIACKQTKDDESCDKYDELKKLEAMRKNVRGYFDIPRIKTTRVKVKAKEKEKPAPVKPVKKEKVTKAQRKRYKDVAKIVQSRRTVRARSADARRTHSKKLKVTPDNIRAWNRHPGKCDLAGIDTKGKGTVKKPKVKKVTPKTKTTKVASKTKAVKRTKVTSKTKVKTKTTPKTKAVRTQKKRSKRAKTMDAKKTNKRKLPVTHKNVKRWKKHPDVFDLIGIDTKGHK